MADDNDFDEWLDDVETDDDGELDQLNIDALLSAVDDEKPTPEDKTASSASDLDQTNIDALLGINSDETPEPETAEDNTESGELDQDNIDALLTSDSDKIAEDLSGDLGQDNIDALLEGTDDDPAEDMDDLDQDNIDAMLASDSDKIAEDLSGDLGQDNIDALLGGTDDDPAEDMDDLEQDNIDALLASNSDKIAEDLSGDLGQDDLDDLLSGAAPPAEKPEAGSETPEEDIDALFNDIDAATSEESAAGPEESSVDELFAEDSSGDETTLSAEASDEVADTAFDSEFDEMDQLFSELDDDSPDDEPFQAEEIDFAEMLDTSDAGEDEFISLGDDDDDFATEEQEAEPADDGNETDISAILTAGDDTATAEDKKTLGGVIPPMLSGMSKTSISAIGGTLVLLLLFGFYFMFSGGDGPDDITVAEVETMTGHVMPASQEEEDNFIPIAHDDTYTMAADGREIPIELQATDEDDQSLAFDVTINPSYGRLSGTAPNFTYLANTNFPGEDSFEYTVSDGKDSSVTATITITGPDLKGQALAEQLAAENRKKKIIAKEIKAKKPAVLAKNVHFYTDSTSPVTINWRRIWQEANKSDYDPKVHVEIVKTETAGRLARATGSSSRFSPDPYSSRTDLIFYRFKKNGFRSQTKTISIDISLGNPAPEIHLAELKEGYPVGQNVSLDASPSRDDSPGNLRFTWQQIAGTPVSMLVSPDNGKKMSFVMPSSFYNQKDNGPTFRLIATDKTGQTSTKEIHTRTITRRQAALWRGSNGGVMEDPALKGQYFPWPYDD